MQRMPERWRSSVADEGHGIESTSVLSRKEAGDEYLLMGLRLTGGISMARYEELAGTPLDEARLATLLGEELLARNSGPSRIHATARGRRVLNAVIAYLCGD